METNHTPFRDLPEIVARVRSGDPAGMERLYKVFARGVRFYLWRQLGSQDLEDKVHDTFLVVVQAIQRGELRDPERLMGFVRTVVRRQLAAYIDRAVHVRKQQVDLEAGLAVMAENEDPEADLIAQQEREIMTEILGGMSERDREVLTRFYLLGHSQERICREMILSETQYRLLKSRAKARFGELGRKRLRQRSGTPILVGVPSGTDEDPGETDEVST